VLAFIAAFSLAACAHVILVRRQPTALPQ
jgi:hypothetical protein